MTDRRHRPISSRKSPQQARSSDLVAAVLEAAVQVLAKEGAQRFTMARVAARAGVSVGSLYQYFPNKAALLFRLQTDEWRATSAALRAIVEDGARPPLDRLRALVHGFIRSECDEAAVRMALGDAAPGYRDAPEARAARAEASPFPRFLEELLPAAPAANRALAGELLTTTLNAAGKRFSEQPRTAAQIDAYAGAMADMFCAYLRGVAAG
jgi:AcrR family transcriptional regulator